MGGTHAGEYYNSDLNKLFFGPYIISSNRVVKAFSPVSELPGRITAITKNPNRPNSALVYTMEQGLYSVDMNSYQVTTLHVDENVLANADRNYISSPLVQGSHGKDIYYANGRSVFIANNGKNVINNIVQYGGLGEYYDVSKNIGSPSSWNTVMPTNFNDIESSPDNSNIWMLGWDTKSVILKVKNSQNVTTDLRFAKSFHNYHAVHGWSTEWPRIMKINDSKYLANMYGSYIEITDKFSAQRLGEITPKTTHLKTVNDIEKVDDSTFAVAGNDLSIINTKEQDFVEIPVSNIEFLPYSKITESGQWYGDGALWLDQSLRSGDVSDSFFIGGYTERVVHFKNAGNEGRLDVGVEIGDGDNWSELSRVHVMPGAYSYYILPANSTAKWLRLKSYSINSKITALLFLETPELLKNTNDNIFNPLLDITSSDMSSDRGIIVPKGRYMEYVSNIYSLANGQVSKTSSSLFTLGANESDQNSSENLLKFTKVDNASSRINAIDSLNNSRNYDYADSGGYISVYDSNRNVFALPISSNRYRAQDIHVTQKIGSRRLLSDTYVLNSYGSFYVIPEDTPGAEGIINIRPISTHNKLISDFNIWRGMLVLSGAKPNLDRTSNYIPANNEKTAGLWFGRVDDLYKFSKPSGYITFWRSSNLSAGSTTPPLLISGYSDKNILFHHTSGRALKFEIYVAFTSRKNSGDRNLPYFHKYGTVTVNSGEKYKYVFPKGFNARWIRIKSLDGGTSVTGSLTLNSNSDPEISSISGAQRDYAPIQEDFCLRYRWNYNVIPNVTPENTPPRDIDSVVLPDGRLKITLLNTDGTGLYVRYYKRLSGNWVPYTVNDNWVFRTQDLPVPNTRYKSYDHVLFPNNVLKQSALVDNSANDFYFRYLTWNSASSSWTIGSWTKVSPDLPYRLSENISSLHYILNTSKNALQISVKNSSDGRYYYRWLNWDRSTNTWLNEPPFLTDSSYMNWYSRNYNQMNLTTLDWSNLGSMSVEQLGCVD